MKVKIRKYLHHAKICKDKEKYKYLDHAKSRAGLRACGVDCDQAVDSAWVTHGKSGHRGKILTMIIVLSWLFIFFALLVLLFL